MEKKTCGKQGSTIFINLSNQLRLLPLELLSLEAKHGANIRYSIDQIHFNAEQPLIHLTVSVDPYSSEEQLQQWQLEIIGYVYSQLSSGPYHTLNCETEHPLLWPYNDVSCQLYFTGQITEPAALFVALYKVHHDFFGRYIPFEDFLNAACPLTELLKTTSGLLATGPKPLMLNYAACLLRHNATYSIIGERMPDYWDGEKHRNDPRSLKILFMNDSYIIAEQFDFFRLP